MGGNDDCYLPVAYYDEKMGIEHQLGTVLLCINVVVCIVFSFFSLWYCIKYHKIRLSKQVISAAVLLLPLSVPLLLFVGLVSEIKASYISILCLVQFRKDELNGADIFTNVKDLMQIYLKHPQVLFNLEYPLDLYRETVEWKITPQSGLSHSNLEVFGGIPRRKTKVFMLYAVMRLWSMKM